MISVNGRVIDYSLFPNNEIQLKPLDKDIINTAKRFEVELRYDNSIDIPILIFIKNYLDEKYPTLEKSLIMKYIPYERMDRQTEHQMFTCKYFCNFINSLRFSRVYVLDPHSNVSAGLLNRVFALSLNEIITDIIKINDIDAIFLPDVGAYKKYSEILANVDIPKFWGNKHRDLESGAITDYSIIGDFLCENKNILIVDDICVKGFTTYFASKKLKELGAKKVIFYCSHCEDSIYKGKLLKSDYVDHIYTTNSLKFDEHKKITIIK